AYRHRGGGAAMPNDAGDPGGAPEGGVGAEERPFSEWERGPGLCPGPIDCKVKLLPFPGLQPGARDMRLIASVKAGVSGPGLQPGAHGDLITRRRGSGQLPALDGLKAELRFAANSSPRRRTSGASRLSKPRPRAPG